MISLNVLFWIFVVMYGIIGATRGWAKEVLVSFSVVLTLFIISILTDPAHVLSADPSVNPKSFFWVRTVMLCIMVFFGYQSASIGRFSGSSRFQSTGASNIILGALVGALNGYLIFGTLWFFLYFTNYPFPGVIHPPQMSDPFYEASMTWISRLPPMWLNPPQIYFAIAIAFAFILVVLL